MRAPISSRILLATLAVILLARTSNAQEHRADLGAVDSLLSRTWEHKLISSGDNFPSVNLRREHRADLAILLHERVPLEDIGAHFDWTEADLQSRLDELIEAGLVRPDDEYGFVPTLMVMSAAHVEQFMPVAETLVEETVVLIEGKLHEIRQLYGESPGLSHTPFEQASLLVLSNVVLDNWQINAVEDRFLRSERPLRGGKRYYFSLQEDDPTDSTEAFGIYGNQYRGFGRYTLGVYGNRRSNNPVNFATLGAEELTRLFGVEPDTVSVFKRELLAHLVRASEGSAMPDSFERGFEAIGWTDEGRVLIPILGSQDTERVDEIAALLTDDLLAILDENRPILQRIHASSPFGQEVSFEEYFIWWYHLYYTAVTDHMAAKGMLTVPESGITSYVIVRDD